jgi:hypothetical protein
MYSLTVPGAARHCQRMVAIREPGRGEQKMCGDNSVAHVGVDISGRRKAWVARQIRKIATTRSHTFSTTDRQDVFK